MLLFAVSKPSLNFWPRVLEDVKSTFDTVRYVNQTVGIDVKIVEHWGLLAWRRRWNEVAYLFRAKLISNVKNAETGIIISYKDNILALK